MIFNGAYICFRRRYFLCFSFLLIVCIAIRQQIDKALGIQALNQSYQGQFDTFIKWPHGSNFRGYTQRAEWVAGQVKLAYDYCVLNKDSDYIQRRAFLDGIFFPRSNDSLSSNVLKNYNDFHIFSSNDAINCLLDKKVYIVGDSYMKQLYVGLADVLLENASNVEMKSRSIRDHVYASSDQQLKRRFGNKLVVAYMLDDIHHKDLYAYQQAFKTHSFWRNADAVVMNVLVHHVEAHKNKTDIISAYLKELKTLFGMKDIKLTWCTGPAYEVAKLPLQYANPAKYRLFYKLDLAAADLADRMGIPSLDFLTMTRNCLWKNCTVDRSHSSRFVERMKAQLLLNKLCRFKHTDPACQESKVVNDTRIRTNAKT